MDAAGLREYRRRWEKVAQRERDELRGQSIDLRLSQTLSLMALGRALGLAESPDDGPAIEEVRARWAKLKAAIPR